MRHKQVLGLLPPQQDGSRFTQIALQPVAGDLTEGQQPLLVALAQNAQHVVLQAHMKSLERHEFTHPQATGVHEFEHGAVAHGQRRVFAGRRQQCFHLRLGQRLGNAQSLFGRLQPQCRVGLDQALAQRPAKIALEYREPPVGRGRPGGIVTGREIAVELSLRRLDQLAPVLTEPAGIQLKITPVGCQRVFGQTLLQPERIDEGINVRHEKVSPGNQSSLRWAVSTTFL